MKEPPDEETPEWRILYTGDFRFEEPFDLSSLQALHDPHGNVIRVDEMFLDTTFASNDYKSFPSREEALVKIWDKVQVWTQQQNQFLSVKLLQYVVALVSSLKRQGQARGI